MASFQLTHIVTYPTAGQPVRHPFVRQATPTGHLLVIFPGRGYTCENPLLYYLRRAALEVGYDVLCMTYSFQVNPSGDEAISLGDELALLMAQVNIADWERVVFAGKSLGTPIAVEQARTHAHKHPGIILLTPIGSSASSARDFPALAFIGTHDRYYDPVQAGQATGRLRWHVYDRLNHSLEDPLDLERSIHTLADVTAHCRAFLLAQASEPHPE